MVSLTYPSIRILSLYRYAVKGLGPGDPLDHVTFTSPGETFKDDRRYALKPRTTTTTTTSTEFDPEKPEWIHKENFICAFTEPELLSTFDTRYDDDTQRLAIWKRPSQRRTTDDPILGPVDLSTSNGRNEVSDFFTRACGMEVECITASSSSAKQHVHQFGNTKSGVRERGDTRTVHIINAATVRDVSEKLGIPLNVRRFRPNIVIDGLDPWVEFKCVGKTWKCENNGDGGVELDIIARTVRCKGVSVDPFDLDRESLDIPKLLQEHFPEHGPYLGVYAVVKKEGTLKIGDGMKVLSQEESLVD